ncbi:hypothetical protein ACPOL_4598 [Acidisarcina polymorpha]|uniref:Uncharacterized protein n=1 Tax=Acidisarcina polymorpha TaxID=2211140 RepID=A0A2Z5G4H7_9BACT|nr:hypothetical protein ACPOL_4598 [Acidisarcina polymorpha]
MLQEQRFHLQDSNKMGGEKSSYFVVLEFVRRSEQEWRRPRNNCVKSAKG